MTRLTAIALAVLAVAIAFPAGSVAGKPDHTRIDETYADSLCGVPVTVHDEGHVISSISGNIEKDRYEFHTTFTTASGVVVLLHDVGTASGTITPVANGDGTYTSTLTYKGLPEQFKLPHGGVLTRDAGSLTIVDTLDSNFQLIDEQLISHGPHPEAASGFALECQILGPILGG